MGSMGGEVGRKKKAMWLYPKIMGFNPPERWGHSSCFSNGFLYVFGGCCGGLHFSDILVLNLETMAWTNLKTRGTGPGPRDSHSAVLVGHKMIVFGGTNGSKKVNDLHIFDLRTKEWTRPYCRGFAPSPRESHTATLVGEDKMVIFGGSGEGGANYLNDLHVLDLRNMRWSSPEAKGDIPVPRDSHSAVAIGNRIFVYGGDCGDRYQGGVDMLDMDSMMWSRLAVQGSSPGVRAGHAAVYVIGGVGDKKYYNDVWVLNISTCSWTQLEILGQKPQGRFSHTATVTDSDIAIYGGCGEDERPLNELLILQLGAEHPKGRYNISMCKIFGSHCNQEKRRFIQISEDNSEKTIISLGDNEAQELELDSKHSSRSGSDTLHPKRRRMSNLKASEIESEAEEHSLSLSQHSSPSHSDQEQTHVKKAQIFPLFNQRSPGSGHWGAGNQTNPRTIPTGGDPQDLCFLGENLNHSKSEQNPHVVHMGRHNVQCSPEPRHVQNMIGAEIHGKVDGSFDSGYLMTAAVNGRIFRGVLFAPGPELVCGGATILGQTHSSQSAQQNPNLNQMNPTFLRCTRTPLTVHALEPVQTPRQANATRPSPTIRTSSSQGGDPKQNGSELQGVVLTLGGPGLSDHDIETRASRIS
ncbi:hypothetical protein LguiA_026697 [Lonicera macranthoides]